MLRGAALLIYSFGFAAFLGLALIWPRYARPVNAGKGRLYRAIFWSGAAWFALNLATLSGLPNSYAYLLALACLFPFFLGALFESPAVRVLAALCAALAASALLGAPPAWINPLYCGLLLWGGSGALRLATGRRALAGVLLAAALLVPAALSTGSAALLLAMRSLPIALLLVEAHAHRRFLFIDLFVKWGLYYLLGLAGAWLWLRAIPSSYGLTERALLLLPLLGGLPPACRALGRWIDRRFLLRPHSPADATRRFLEAISTSTPGDLDSRARAALESIFNTSAHLHRGGFALDARPDGGPFFSEDLRLLTSLNEAYCLARAKLDAESRRRELSERATQAELKALRAQINPHFLFNALNTVAGLIPRDPALAEATVERLADVFRYTLRRDGGDLAPLAEELDFIQAWLAVERARFGPRLTVEIDIPPETLRERIPAMLLQTLVENALKHGVAATTGPARVVIEARRYDRHLTLAVRDNGPALREETGGMGLANTRARLAGHYGDNASLTLAREGAETVAAVAIPLEGLRCAS